ncbi:MAG: glutaredoxin domain-containing protein [Finegoldia sp.]|nr:glutaredoxin domain-containing protein [Finegoldia sp.]
MKKIFISDKCPDCRRIFDLIDEKKDNFDFINITESMANLKEFLRYRDKLEEFDIIRENNKVGIPVMIDENNKAVFLTEKEIENL